MNHKFCIAILFGFSLILPPLAKYHITYIKTCYVFRRYIFTFAMHVYVSCSFLSLHFPFAAIILSHYNVKSVLSLNLENGKLLEKIDINTQQNTTIHYTNQAYIKYIRSYDTKLFERNRKSCFFVDPLSFDYSKLLGFLILFFVTAAVFFSAQSEYASTFCTHMFTSCYII